MRSIPSTFELISPASLEDVLALMASAPGKWMPFAGGTEIMVQFAAGKAIQRQFVNIRGLPQLDRITVNEGELHIGAGCTYTQLRSDPIIASEFPLLGAAASWTGGIANQNRGTLGGNIVNASPAADSLPALLVYDAELILASVRGTHRISYQDFHTGYKRTRLQSDELVLTIVLPRRYSGYITYSRKVGPRNAQAISKLCIAVAAKANGDMIEDIRIAMGSVAPVPVRLHKTEEKLTGRKLSSTDVSTARLTLESEISPIDDLRSTSFYRRTVAGNLLEEFLINFCFSQGHATEQNRKLEQWNLLPFEEAVVNLLSCCGSQVWAEQVASSRPYKSFEDLSRAATSVWRKIGEDQWLLAFRSHPRIGEQHADNTTTRLSAEWSAQEQNTVQSGDDEIRQAIAAGNRLYEVRFGRIFIISAAGRSPSEILSELERRLRNTDEAEMVESADQQEQITYLRLQKWLSFEGQL
ncbi:2-oxo-4-hydroxy-4-carboxy-5-ureidoimidazoline decarboxylase [Edaphobacter sp. HDX4]|uniref:2-oxo-4-hydroxy-4-carboxy-5-ureidoimidazoline decarboxylase n=1 Tax=Edaphobacter sp. HDX4 TaxID=2794064 RepID=UPI002FE5805A